MTIPVPTLSTAGWVTSPNEKADSLMAHFYASDKFQSYLYFGQVTTVQWLIEQYGHDIPTLVSQMKAALEVYLGRYYDSVNVDMSSDDSVETVVGNEVELKVYATVSENGKEYSFGALIVAANSKVLRVSKLNNVGYI